MASYGQRGLQAGGLYHTQLPSAEAEGLGVPAFASLGRLKEKYVLKHTVWTDPPSAG
jgi:hypothetical protein